MVKSQKSETSVNIGEFKAKMGQYLKLVRAGKRLLLKDRSMVVATILPVYDESNEIQPAIPATKSVEDFANFKSTKIEGKFDTLEILQELREDKR